MEEEDNNNVALETNILIDEMVIALMKYWFPNRLPVGGDYEKLVEIAMGDANAVYRHLIKIGVVEELEVDE